MMRETETETAEINRSNDGEKMKERREQEAHARKEGISSAKLGLRNRFETSPSLAGSVLVEMK